MADYISREAALELIDNAPIIAGSENETFISAPELSDKVYCLPAADVVEVVRCKDCKYWCSTLTYIDLLEARHDPYTDGVCDLYDCDGFQPNDFCSKAVRRDNYGADMRESNLDTTKGDNND